MSDVTVNWTTGPAILPSPESLPVRQVYVWLLTTDSKVVIVSKDGVSWQLPGGKPADRESLVETAVREVAEETSLNIAPEANRLAFFGYYDVHEPGAPVEDYLQVRYYLPLALDSSALTLTAAGESTEQAVGDIIQHVEAVDFDELTRRISWMSTSPEYQAFRALTAR